MATRPPLPPFTEETARQKVQAAEDAWNTRDPERVALAYTEDSQWRNRDEFFHGREAIVDFLRRKWARELDYRLRKELWAFTDNRISVRFEYESRDPSGQWWRSHGNEHWEFDERRPDAPPRRQHQRLPDRARTSGGSRSTDRRVLVLVARHGDKAEGERPQLTGRDRGVDGGLETPLAPPFGVCQASQLGAREWTDRARQPDEAPDLRREHRIPVPRSPCRGCHRLRRCSGPWSAPRGITEDRQHMPDAARGALLAQSGRGPPARGHRPPPSPPSAVTSHILYISD